MKVYEAIFKEGVTQGMFALGLVYDPAMQDFFVAFNDHEESLIELSTINEDKRMLLGAVLIPNKDILRVDGEGNQFSMRFSADTIEQIGHNWLQKAEHKNFTKEHNEKLENISVVEMWTVSDSEKDKSNFYGKTYPKGTLVAMTKVNDDKTWQDIKNGTIKGYSIEAVLGLKNIEFSNELKTDINMTKQDFLDAFKALFTTEKTVNEEVKVEEIAVVAEATEVVAEPELNTADVLSAVTELKSHFDSQLEALKVEFTTQKAAIEKENEDLKVELSKQPEAAPIKSKGEAKEFEVALTAQGRILQTLRNNK